MQWPAVPGGSVIAGVWLVLDVGFFVALLAHKLGRRGSLVYTVFQDAIRYGKTKTGIQRPAWLHCFDVPKRWFSHFYVVSVTWNGLLLLTLTGFKVPEWMTSLLSFLNVDAQQTGGELSAVLALALIWVHSVRRLIECLFVSVFSEGVIHLVQYCFGLVYYFLLGVTVFIHSRPDSGALSVEDLITQARWYHVFGLMLYLWGSIHQHRCHVIFANLRKNKSGNIVNLNYLVPRGDWFEKVSCPHYFAELVIYISIAFIFGLVNTTWWLVVTYVLFSQALEAVLSHEFYHDKFKSYPPNRKAFIPFVF
ncbi:polyprenol reductase [Spea bombifrons]|uniref:polyprenol reductase n=1 Tax=Spea bombifrons TaxID=233779 RepID=UPI00234B7BEE|nr:polyprenol reductase [Spea bombifrons]